MVRFHGYSHILYILYICGLFCPSTTTSPWFGSRTVNLQFFFYHQWFIIWNKNSFAQDQLFFFIVNKILMRSSIKTWPQKSKKKKIKRIRCSWMHLYLITYIGSQKIYLIFWNLEVAFFGIHSCDGRWHETCRITNNKVQPWHCQRSPYLEQTKISIIR